MIINCYLMVCVDFRAVLDDMYEKKVVVGSGDTANFYCFVKGIFLSEIYWFKGELEVGLV